MTDGAGVPLGRLIILPFAVFRVRGGLAVLRERRR
jgi:hypothetical protein